MNRYKNYGIALLAGALLLAGFSSNALALTAACLPIENQASLTYSVGGVPQTTAVLSDDDDNTGNGINKTSFNVASKVDLSIATITATTDATGVDNILTFRIDNEGNTPQQYQLQLYASASDDFDMDKVRVYTDDDADYTTGTPALIADETADYSQALPTRTVAVPKETSIWVHIVADVPDGQAGLDEAHYTLVARSFHFSQTASDWVESATGTTVNSCGEAVVLADGDADGGGTMDGDKDGDYSASAYYIVKTAALAIKKEYAVISDPLGGTLAIPGAIIEYTMTISNNGAADAEDLRLEDMIPANTEFIKGSVGAAGSSSIDYKDTNWGYVPVGSNGDPDPAVTYLAVEYATLTASSSHVVTFRVVIQ